MLARISFISTLSKENTHGRVNHWIRCIVVVARRQFHFQLMSKEEKNLQGMLFWKIAELFDWCS